MHDYYKQAVDQTTERNVLKAILADSIADNYAPWEGPGLDVECGPGNWRWLKVKSNGSIVTVDGIHGVHEFEHNSF